MLWNNKKRVYNYTPKTWMTQSGMPLMYFNEGASLNSEISATCFHPTTWKYFRIFTNEAPTSNIVFQIFINDSYIESYVITSTVKEYTYSIPTAIELYEGDVVKIKITQMPLNFYNEKIFFGFANSSWECFLDSISETFNYIEEQFDTLKSDIYLKTAKDIRLDQWASDFTFLERDVYDSDDLFREKIINSIIQPKQTKNAILNAVNNIMSKYYPQYFNDLYLNFYGFYSSGTNINSGSSGSGSSGSSGTGFSCTLLEPFYEDAPYVLLGDKGRAGRFYISIPYFLLEENIDSVFKEIENKVELIKAKGIKAQYVKQVQTKNFILEQFNKTNEEVYIKLVQNIEDAYKTQITNLNAFDYLTRSEYARITEFNLPTTTINIKNAIEFKRIKNPEEENLIFNNEAFFIGESALGEDLFIFIKKNYDRGYIAKINNINSDPDDIILNELE